MSGFFSLFSWRKEWVSIRNNLNVILWMCVKLWTRDLALIRWPLTLLLILLCTLVLYLHSIILRCYTAHCIVKIKSKIIFQIKKSRVLFFFFALFISSAIQGFSISNDHPVFTFVPEVSPLEPLVKHTHLLTYSSPQRNTPYGTDTKFCFLNFF